MPLTRRGERLATASTIVFGMMIGYFLPEDPFHQTPDQVSANVYTYAELVHPPIVLDNEVDPPRPVFVNDNKYYAYNKLFKLQREREWICLDKLWSQESQWNPYAQNPNSTAYGIAQFLDQTWKQTGINKTDDAKKQIDAGLIYIEQRYKESPCLAWEHSQRKGYY
jgi:hypothetical protein